MNTRPIGRNSQEVTIKDRTRRFAFTALISGILTTLALPASALAGPNIQDGNWEQTIEFKMNIPGMPMEMPPMKFTDKRCLTQKDLVPNTAQKDQKCEVKDQKIVGDKVTWRVECVDAQGKTEGQGEVTYSGTSYKGTMKAKMTPKQQGAQPMTVDYKLSGRRLGDCPR